MARFPQTALALVLFSVGCGQWEDQTRALETAREVLECFDVAVERTESHRFHAVGCDRHADIACSEGALQPVCIRVRERTAGGESVEDEDDVAEEDLSGDGEPEGEVLVADGYSIEEVAPDPEADDEALDDAPGAIRTTATGGVAEAAIRRGLDARRDDVMACVDRDRVTVRVTYHTDGAIVIALTGDLSGSPEEGCVRSAMGDVRVPAGESGVVLHLVRRPTVAPPTPEPEPAAPSEPPPVAPTAT